MRTELNVPPLSTLTEHQPLNQAAALNLFEQLVDEYLGPVLSCDSVDPAPGESGRFHRCQSVVPTTSHLSDSGYEEREITGGAGMSPRIARLRSIGEAIERYCLSMCKHNDFKRSTYLSLDDQALNLRDINIFTDWQLVDRDTNINELSKKEFYWTATRELTSGDRVLIPGQCLYLPFPATTVVRQPISTGAASGVDYGDTLVRALTEIVEREAYMIGYLNALRYPAFDLTTTNDPVVEALLDDLNLMGWDVTVLDATLDHPFRTCLTIAVKESGKPVLSLGLDAEPDVVAAIRGSLIEAYQFALPTEDGISSTEPIRRPIRSINNRRIFWNDRDRLDALDFWLENEQQVTIEPVSESDDPIDTFETFLRQRDLKCYIKDVTTEDVESAGCRVLKAFAPNIQPLHLDESFKYLGTERLYKVPVQVGYLEEPRTRDEFTNLPHPFL